MEKFHTQDVNLAAYLVFHKVNPPEIEPLKPNLSAFIFDEPPIELLRKWLRGDSPEEELISIYQHLLKDAWRAQNQAFPRGGGK